MGFHRHRFGAAGSLDRARLVDRPVRRVGVVAYYVFRDRVSRWALRALVVGIPFAVALGLALILGTIVLYLNARYLNAISE
jgi:hypothetical protein